MKKCLPVNLEEEIRSYSYYAFPYSIFSANEYAGPLVARFAVEDYEQEVWQWKTGELKLGQEGDQMTATATNPYGENRNGCMLRSLKDDDYICLHIGYQQYSNPWGAINLFITDMDDDSVVMGDDDYICRMGIFSYDGIYFRHNNKTKPIVSASVQEKYGANPPSVLLLHRLGNLVEGYIGTCKEDLVLAYQAEIEPRTDLYIGVQVKMNDNMYEKWLLHNYIQLSFVDSPFAWRMDFYYGVIKEWRFDWVNYFLNTSRMELNYVNKFGSVAFLKDNIQNNRYVEVKLDQYYVANREEYHRQHHLHQNLIYGYDNAKKCFMVLGYLSNGHLATTTISYGDVKLQFDKQKSVKDIYIVEYKLEANMIEYNLSYIAMLIREYLNGDNSGFHLNMLVYQRDERTYGMKIYDEWLRGYGLERVLRDRRITHLLYEHKCMQCKRIDYILYKEKVDEEVSERIKSQAQETQKIALELRNLVLKYDQSHSEAVKVKVLECIDKLQKVERHCLEELLDCV